jgi:hypothetical protein
VITFHLVLFSWIFFRANNLDDALLIIQRIPQLGTTTFTEAIFATWQAAGVADVRLEMALSVGLIVILEIIQWYERYIANMERTFTSNPGWLRWLAYIYFQF